MERNLIIAFKMMIILIFSMMAIMVNASLVYASGEVIDPDDYKPDSQIAAQNADELKRIGNIIIGSVRVVGSIASIIVLIVLGIKYMMGGIEEKAQFKKTMGPYIVGAVMVFAIVNILGIVVEFAQQI